MAYSRRLQGLRVYAGSNMHPTWLPWVFAGLIYWIDIGMRFRMGFCVVYNLKRELIMDGGLIAHFYVRHDTFLLDFLAALPSIAEASPHLPSGNIHNLDHKYTVYTGLSQQTGRPAVCCLVYAASQHLLQHLLMRLHCT